MTYDPPRCVCGHPKNNHAMNMRTYACTGMCSISWCGCPKFAKQYQATVPDARAVRAEAL